MLSLFISKGILHLPVAVPDLANLPGGRQGLATYFVLDVIFRKGKHTPAQGERDAFH